jgi:hypothetical protein
MARTDRWPWFDPITSPTCWVKGLKRQSFSILTQLWGQSGAVIATFPCQDDPDAFRLGAD